MNQNEQTLNEGSHYRSAKDKWGQNILIPVIDVRDGIGQRMAASYMEKSSNRSKYMNYNQYHRSQKKQYSI